MITFSSSKMDVGKVKNSDEKLKIKLDCHDKLTIIWSHAADLIDTTQKLRFLRFSTQLSTNLNRDVRRDNNGTRNR